jgi:hypothetical protein
MEEGNVSNLIHNERIKLTATFANNLAVGAFLGAIFIPIASKISTNEIDLVHGLIYVWGSYWNSWAAVTACAAAVASGVVALCEVFR